MLEKSMTLPLVLLSCCYLTSAQRTGGSFYGPILNKTEEQQQNGACVNNKNQVIPEGFLYTPGLDECQVCRCLKQMPVMCRTVLCAPPTNCLRLRVGSACCQWICDDWDKPENFSDIGLRLVASGVTAILSLSLLFFLVYRLRQRRLRGRQNHFQAENFNSELGSVDHSWYGDHQLTHMGWRKPFAQHSRPFPPSYDEAVMSGDHTMVEEAAPQYPGEPTIPYQVATMGRQVLPPLPPLELATIPYQVATMGRQVLPPLPQEGEETNTLPSRLRRFREPVFNSDEYDYQPPQFEELVYDESALEQDNIDYPCNERLAANSPNQSHNISHGNLSIRHDSNNDTSATSEDTVNYSQEEVSENAEAMHITVSNTNSAAKSPRVDDIPSVRSPNNTARVTPRIDIPSIGDINITAINSRINDSPSVGNTSSATKTPKLDDSPPEYRCSNIIQSDDDHRQQFV